MTLLGTNGQFQLLIHGVSIVASGIKSKSITETENKGKSAIKGLAFEVGEVLGDRRLSV